MVAAAGVIAARSPIYSAMSLVGTFFCLAGIYVLLLAHTIAVLQVLVYAGAIMVLFLFVIMLLSLGGRSGAVEDHLPPGGGRPGRGGPVRAAGDRQHAPSFRPNARAPASFGTLQSIGAQLYTQWLAPFEAVSLLLLVAMVGAVVVAKSRV